MLKRGGVGLLFLGIGSFILPLFGMQFRLLNLFGAAAPVAGVFFALVGGGLLLAGIIKGSGSPAAPMKQAVPPMANQTLPLQPAYSPPANISPRKCMRCGEALALTDTFCGGCGAPASAAAPRRCPNPRCGRAAASGKNFCGACGTRLM